MTLGKMINGAKLLGTSLELKAGDKVQLFPAHNIPNGQNK